MPEINHLSEPLLETATVALKYISLFGAWSTVGIPTVPLIRRCIRRMVVRPAKRMFYAMSLIAIGFLLGALIYGTLQVVDTPSMQDWFHHIASTIIARMPR